MPSVTYKDEGSNEGHLLVFLRGKVVAMWPRNNPPKGMKDYGIVPLSYARQIASHYRTTLQVG